MILILMFTAFTYGVVDYELNHTPKVEERWTTQDRIASQNFKYWID